MQPIDFPDFKDWSIVAVHLLQGVVYAEETKHWSVLLRYRNELELFFIRIGLMLIVDEGEEFAYLRQLNEDEKVDGYENIPILFRRKTITKDASYLCVLLRDTLHQFDESLNDSRTSRCTITTDELLEQWKAFFLPDNDGKKVLDKFNRALATVEDLKYIEKLNGQEPETWEIRRIIKARIPIDELERLCAELARWKEKGKTSDDE